MQCSQSVLDMNLWFEYKLITWPIFMISVLFMSKLAISVYSSFQNQRNFKRVLKFRISSYASYLSWSQTVWWQFYLMNLKYQCPLEISLILEVDIHFTFSWFYDSFHKWKKSNRVPIFYQSTVFEWISSLYLNLSQIRKL